ncbi:UDP-N-acetylmuramoyl-tripeptide--D-alanyl-D-alanine ligase [Aneurinibacillus soli]|uniref:UDP-N-acetylmuramoyl-tripeptide--D-alanyl-D-alanine ligase n=1 Tax=Aneurinibacillus soli TaxID=1500254 RepID=A0A0U5BAY5_9BACL|nr:UDP-N-acetylmuramoyl-tripeptide--D-alanyl-D-alanine ligase [Aneurinibacillus soli]PYE61318.1 UDP-N-acetylmuramoyl-tripeptide--D-alanyl-D-alanine ligase [Aneurinibacillus soli]BAU27853.1 UDP-N-acetylmuramoyl-tripeptide--D-alanyl-D-alanine ligase [Aneurinibacillus soli]
MKSLSLGEILPIMKGKLLQGNIDEKIINVTTEPDEVQKNSLFFDVYPTLTDWNMFPFRDSVVIVTDHPWRMEGKVARKISVVYVKSIEQAYWAFVEFYRGLFDIPVIGVTGTCGKTTTTEMLKTVLSQNYCVQSTFDGKNSLSYNLPYVMEIDEQTEAAVYEMGVSHPGCIENSCRHFQPQIGIILNIGVYHLLGCKTFDNYIKAKKEMVKGIHPQGTLILNADDENIGKIDVSSFQGEIVYFGTSERAHFQAKNIRYEEGGMSYTLRKDNQKYPVFVSGYGEHNVLNSLACLAAATSIIGNVEQAIQGLSEFRQVRQHLEFLKGPKGCTLIDDTWNCTPPSMTSSLKVLTDTAQKRQKIAVLGYMPQLGDNAKDEYDNMAYHVKAAAVDHVIVIGEARLIGQKAEKLGVSKKRISYCETAEEVQQAVTPFLKKNSLVLLKFPYKFRLSKDHAFQKFMQWIRMENNQ